MWSPCLLKRKYNFGHYLKIKTKLQKPKYIFVKYQKRKTKHANQNTILFARNTCKRDENGGRGRFDNFSYSWGASKMVVPKQFCFDPLYGRRPQSALGLPEAIFLWFPRKSMSFVSNTWKRSRFCAPGASDRVKYEGLCPGAAHGPWNRPVSRRRAPQSP